MTKVTISTKFGEVIKALKGEDTTLSTDELIAFIEERQAQAQKKAGFKKETERQKDMNTPEVSGFATAEPLSNQRVTAVLRLMITNDGTVGKNKVGKSMKYFAIG